MKCKCHLKSTIDNYDGHALGCPCHPRNVRIAKQRKLEKQQASQQSAHPTLLEERKIDVYCPHCGNKFEIALPASQSG